MSKAEKFMAVVTVLNTIWSIRAWMNPPEQISLKRLEVYPVMAFKICFHLLLWYICIVFFVERLLVKYWLGFKKQGVFYKSLRENLLFTYLLLLYFSDEGALV